MYLYFLYRILNTSLTGYGHGYIYFNYTHFNTVSTKTRTFVFLNTREINTFNTHLLGYVLIIFFLFNKIFQLYIFIFRHTNSILLVTVPLYQTIYVKILNALTWPYRTLIISSKICSSIFYALCTSSHYWFL